jgi:hypothetical protein
MSVVLVCPSCAAPYTLHRPPVPDVCDRCRTPFSDAVRQVADQSLRAEAAPRPLLLTLGLAFVTLWFAVVVLIFVVALVGNGPYKVDGQPVTKSEFFSDPRFFAFAPVIVISAWIAWALWRERPWARPLMLGSWIVVGVPPIFARDADWASRVSSILFVVITMTIASWYLYGKANVVAYFQRLKESSASRTDA